MFASPPIAAAAASESAWCNGPSRRPAPGAASWSNYRPITPVFQRDYTWDAETQCAQLWRDVLRASRTSGERGHFLGSIVYIATGDSLAGFTRWMLIDGQQRLTTLTLLLAALRDHISETKWSGGRDQPDPRRIDAYFLKNVQEEGDREQKLVLRRHDQATLRAIVDGKEPPHEASDH